MNNGICGTLLSKGICRLLSRMRAIVLLLALLAVRPAAAAPVFTNCSLSGNYVVSAAIDMLETDQFLGVIRFHPGPPPACALALADITGDVLRWRESQPYHILNEGVEYAVSPDGRLIVRLTPDIIWEGRLGQLTADGIAQSLVFVASVASATDVRFSGVAIREEADSLAGQPGPPGPKGDKGDPGLPAAKGDKGDPGPQGLIGPAGVKGDRGDSGQVGPHGLQGPAGANGANGAPGLQGPAGQQGIAGPKGDTGASGPQGSQGSAGSAGPQGPQGTAGANGLAGAPGIQGPAGPQGDTGSAGAQGPSGPAGAGFSFQNAWASATAYVPNDIVSSNGSTWIALANNTDVVPGTNATKWSLLAAKGDPGDSGSQGLQGPAGPAGAAGAVGPAGSMGATGPAGPQGLQGLTGSQGPTGLQGPSGAEGATGPQGATGPVGMTFRDAWASGTSYALNDAVTFGGESWFAIATSAGVPPGTDPAKWSLLATKGSDGATGPAGSQGPQGPSGPAGPTGTTGPAGSQGPQGLTGFQGPQGSEGSAGPQGIQGPTGQTGAAGQQGTTGVQGPVGMVFQDAWSNVTSYSPTDVATYQGETWFSLLANTNVAPGSDATKWAKLAAKGTDGATGSAGPQGLQGLQGLQGIQGPTGTTGPAGATGPQGLTGSQGLTGAAGPQGSSGPQGTAGSTGPQGLQGPAGPEGLQGSQGATGLTGPQGPSGPAGAAGAGSILAGSTGTTNLSNTGTQYLAFGVFVAPAATESRQAIVLPNRACTAQKLMVRLSSNPGTGTSRIFTVRTSADGFTAFADTALTCTIADLASSCDSGATQVALIAGAGITASSNVTGSPTLVTAKYAFECLP